jgi:hypothetical protein
MAHNHLSGFLPSKNEPSLFKIKKSSDRVTVVARMVGAADFSIILNVEINRFYIHDSD